MLIKVTQEHIDKGIKCTRYHCPIALAMSNAGYSYPRVCDRFAYWWEGEAKKRENFAPLPTEACRFIKNFDHYDFVSPFEFELPDMT